MTTNAKEAAGVDILESASDSAKAVMGAWFGMMCPGKGELTFELQKSRASDEAQAGLDELVSLGAIHVEPYNDLIGLRYTALVDGHPFFRWLHKNIDSPGAKIVMTTPLGSPAEGAAHRDIVLARSQQARP